MTWFKVDDGFYDHPKVADLPDSAIALWTRAGSWCAKHLTDGKVPSRAIRRFCDDPDEGAKALVDAGMWDRTPEGYAFHDWDLYQPSREETEQKRADHARRQAEYRERQRLAREQAKRKADTARPNNATITDPVSDASRDASLTGSRDASVARTVMPARPVPTRPVPSVVPEGTTTEEDQTLFPAPPAQDDAKPVHSAKLPDGHRFDEFWAAYPHKRDKDDGRKAWAKIVRASQRNGTDVALDDVIAAAGFYRHSKEFVAGFPKHPATFLNKGSWRDFVAGPPVEPQMPAQAGFDAKAARFAELSNRMRTGTDGALDLIRPTPPALTNGDPHA